jgi:hypothetical protein
MCLLCGCIASKPYPLGSSLCGLVRPRPRVSTVVWLSKAKERGCKRTANDLDSEWTPKSSVELLGKTEMVRSQTEMGRGTPRRGCLDKGRSVIKGNDSRHTLGHAATLSSAASHVGSRVPPGNNFGDGGTVPVPRETGVLTSRIEVPTVCLASRERRMPTRHASALLAHQEMASCPCGCARKSM